MSSLCFRLIAAATRYLAADRHFVRRPTGRSEMANGGKGCEAEAVRDYFQVEDEEGARFWLYRRGDGGDGRTGDLSWYLHGVFG